MSTKGLHLSTKRGLALVAILAMAVACATVRPEDDPVVVKTEDFLSNSLNGYNSVMGYHFTNSNSEPQGVYDTLENVREKFPPAWNAVFTALRVYKTTKDRTDLERAMAVLKSLSDSMAPYVGRS